MRSKTLLSISLLSIAALSSACSRHKVSASATPATTSSPNQAAIDAAARENARLRADADDNSEREAAAARSRTAAGDQAALTLPVYFEFDRSEITEDGMRLLDQKVDVLQRNPNVRVRIEGNADDSGSDEYNLALSQRRAAIAHRYFTDRHRRFETQGHSQRRRAAGVHGDPRRGLPVQESTRRVRDCFWLLVLTSPERQTAPPIDGGAVLFWSVSPPHLSETVVLTDERG